MEQINNGVNEKNFICVEYSPALKAQFEEIFNDEFMKKHTNFKSFESFRYSSAVIVNWNAEDLIYYESLMNSFVKESTVFDTWDQMICTAADLKYADLIHADIRQKEEM